MWPRLHSHQVTQTCQIDFKIHDFNANFRLHISLCQDNRDQEGTVLVPK